jgi:hypothetical protein
MNSLAWSSVALLVLLLPGFFFYAGLYAPERFSRDVTPKNPLGTLAGIVLVSLLAHTILWYATPLAGVVDWAAVIEAVQMPSPPLKGTTAAQHAARHFGVAGWHLARYVVLSCVIGFCVGGIAGGLTVRGWIPFLVQHPWAYPLKMGAGGVMSYTHVLTEVAHADKQLVYCGRLKYFSLAADGTFAYVVLAATQQRLLRLGGDVPQYGAVQEIAAATRYPESPPASGAPRRRVAIVGRRVKDRLRWPWWPGKRGATTAHPLDPRPAPGGAGTGEPKPSPSTSPGGEEGPLMVIPGCTIKNVVFHGVYQITGLREARSEAAELTRRLAGGDVEEQMRTLADHLGLEAPAPVDAQAVPSPRQLQQSLARLGLYTGSVDGRTGSLTRSAVLLFQRAHGLLPDGIAGPETCGPLRDMVARVEERERREAGSAGPVSGAT